MQLLTNEQEPVFVLADDRHLDEMDAQPLNPGESADFHIECNVSSSFVKPNTPYILLARYNGSVGEADFEFPAADLSAR